MLTAVHFMLRNDVGYRDLGPQHFDRRDKAKAIRRLVKRLADLGCDVEIRGHAT
jgi:transposase